VNHLSPKIPAPAIALVDTVIEPIDCDKHGLVSMALDQLAGCGFRIRYH
jgi:hypothetical protein